MFLSHVFVFVNMISQIAGCVMVLIRKQVKIAVAVLFGVILLQVIYLYIIVLQC